MLERLRRDPWLLAVLFVAALYATIVLWLTRRGAALPPDSTDYAEAARSLVRGQGDTVNRIVFHTGVFPGIRHPLEVHGLLQPPLIAVLFALWGPNGGLVRVPSVLFAAALLVVSFWGGRRLFGTVAGAFAAALLLTRGDVLLMSVFGSDDVGEALFAFGSLCSFTLGATTQGRGWFVAAGVLAGLASLEKVTGLVLVPAFALVMLLNRTARSAGVRAWLWTAVPTALAFALYTYRNYRVYGHFGSPYGALAWFGKESFPQYFAFYEVPPKMSEVWSRLGGAKLLSLTVDQMAELGKGVAMDPVAMLGVLSLAVLARRHAIFVATVAIYTVGLVLLVCIGHHLEMRYLSPLLPVSGAAFGGTVAAGVTRAAEARERWRFVRPLAWGAIAVLALAGAGITYVLSERLGVAMQRPGPCDDAARFVKATVDPSAVVMTSNPWFVTWETERASVNAPTNGDAALIQVVRIYKVAWAMTGGAAIGALDLDAALASPVLQSALRPERVFDGAACDVYRFRSSEP